MNPIRVHRLAAVVLALAVPGVSALAAKTPAAQMTIGQGEAWVRLHFPPSGESDLRSIRWENPPDGLQPDTLRVWTPKRPAPLAGWHWLDDTSAPPTDPAAPLVWTPSPAAPTAAPENRPLELLLAAPLSDAMGHSLTFRLSGFSWTARYHMTVRGLGGSSLKQAQIDLAGTVRVQNDTATAWPGVLLSFTGPRDTPPGPPPAKPFGIPELDRGSPLAAPWFPPPPGEPPLPDWWPLRIPADLSAHGPTEIPHLRVLRKPARVVHAYDSGAVPLPTPEPGAPLARVLRIPNTPEMGLGLPLLPGPLDWTDGARATHPDVHSTALPHTPYPGVLEIPLGPVAGSRASRSASPAVAFPDGTRQLDVAIHFANDLDGEIDIEATERPPAPAWNLVSSSIPCTATDETLSFSFSLPPRSVKTLTYRLRLPAPR